MTFDLVDLGRASAIGAFNGMNTCDTAPLRTTAIADDEVIAG
jgi:hypothetical protein